MLHIITYHILHIITYDMLHIITYDMLHIITYDLFNILANKIVIFHKIENFYSSRFKDNSFSDIPSIDRHISDLSTRVRDKYSAGQVKIVHFW